MSNMQITVFQNHPKQTPFAPEWNYFLAEDQLDEVDFNEIARIILSKEKDIIQKYPSGTISVDAYTGLGENSLTSKWQHFNVFKWQEPEIIKLKEAVYKRYIALLEALKVPRKRVYAQCWANVLRDGQDIKQHIHGIHQWIYLSGHITVKCTDTATAYVNPANQLRSNDAETYYIKNQVGHITFFPSYIPHFTTVHHGDEERISIAFDLMLNNTLKNGETDFNTVPFDYAE